jgi:hypothetical protein
VDRNSGPEPPSRREPRRATVRKPRDRPKTKKKTLASLQLEYKILCEVANDVDPWNAAHGGVSKAWEEVKKGSIARDFVRTELRIG